MSSQVITPSDMNPVSTNLNSSSTRDELSMYFNSLKPPKSGSFKGAHMGKLYAVEGIRFLPWFIRSPIHKVLQSNISPWRGKFFDGKKGGNMVLNSTGETQFGFYTIAHGSAYDDSGKVILLDYDVPENPVVMWNICGELREISTGYYLARMLYRTKKMTVTVLYFTLEK